MNPLVERAALRLQREILYRLLSSRLHAGPGTYFSWPLPRVIAYPGDPPYDVVLGGYCSVSAAVEFMIGGNHHTDRVTTFPFPPDGNPYSKGPVVVGNDVWIGRNAIVLSGVTVGDGAVIGANSVVTRDVRPYAIVAGNPAREIRRRFPDDQVDRLLEVAWWSWPQEEIKRITPLLVSTDIEPLLDYAARRRA
jgi:acetyltransferase-like isoleucine patch superfamily enzyme